MIFNHYILLCGLIEFKLEEHLLFSELPLLERDILYFRYPGFVQQHGIALPIGFNFNVLKKGIKNSKFDEFVDYL